MTIQTRLKGKILGQYYTPNYIVDYIIDQTLGFIMKNNSYERVHSLRILDPACGLGIFLVQALEFLLSHFKSKEEAGDPDKLRRSIIANQLYGIDIDNQAIVETQAILRCSPFNANLKVFDALLPPQKYELEYDITKLIELRKQHKEHFIERDERSSEKEEQLEIIMIEDLIKRIITKKLENKFYISSNDRILPWEIAFPETKGEFDIIIGNPPWGALFSSDFLKFYEVGTQQADSWSLFLEKSLKALKDGGRLGFVLPNTLLTNENYTAVRKLILETCRIIKLINLGDKIFPKVTQPCMLIILEKGRKNSSHQIEIIRYVSQDKKKLLEQEQRSLSSLSTISCSQNRFLCNTDYQFDIYSIGFEGLKEIIEKDLYHDKIQVKPLKDLVENARGVELNKNGKVVKCSSCGWWSSPPSNVNSNGVKAKLCNNPECHKEITEHDKTDHIVFDKPQQPERDRPFLVGFQIQRYHIRNHWYIDPTRKGIIYKDPTLYHGLKLLLRKTGRGIKTAIDYNNRWVSQVVYIFKLKKNVSVPLEYIMGVLNSRLIHKYYYMEFADPYRQDFPHFTQKRFLRLPIKVPVTYDEKSLTDKISEKAKLLQSQYQRRYSQIQQPQEKTVNVEQIDQKIQKLEKEIDNLVFKIYQLTTDQEKEIRSEF